MPVLSVPLKRASEELEELFLVAGHLKASSMEEWLEDRYQKERQGKRLSFFLEDDEGLVGWAGVFESQQNKEALETTTHFLPRIWGNGAFWLAANLQWELSHILGRPLIVSISTENHRSLAAHKKLIPYGWREVEEPHKSRISWVASWDDPPQEGLKMTDQERLELLAHCKEMPGYALRREP